MTLRIPPSGAERMGRLLLHRFKYLEMLPGQEQRGATKNPLTETIAIGILVTTGASRCFIPIPICLAFI